MSTHLTTPEAIKVIDSSAARYSVARGLVAKLLSGYQTELAALQKKHFPRIRDAAREAADCKGQLNETLAQYPEIFAAPRTMTLHGIKVGFQKGKGKIDWADDEKLAERILKHFPGQYDVLVKTTHKPIAKALASLAVADLRKLGCEVEETGDFVYIKAEKSAIDKLVAKLLDEGSQPEEAA